MSLSQALNQFAQNLGRYPSLALEYPSWIVRRMSGRRRRIFLASSTISGMREWDARNTQWFSSPRACSTGCLSRVLNSSLNC